MEDLPQDIADLIFEYRDELVKCEKMIEGWLYMIDKLKRKCAGGSNGEWRHFGRLMMEDEVKEYWFKIEFRNALLEQLRVFIYEPGLTVSCHKFKKWHQQYLNFFDNIQKGVWIEMNPQMKCLFYNYLYGSIMSCPWY